MNNRFFVTVALVGSLGSLSASSDLSLHMAIADGDLTAAQEAIKNGANVHMVLDGKTALIDSVEQVTKLFDEQGFSASLKLFGKALKRTAATRASIPLLGNALLAVSALNSNALGAVVQVGVGGVGMYILLDAMVDRALAERASIVELLALHPQQTKEQLEKALQQVAVNRLVAGPKRAVKAIAWLEQILRSALTA
jgi:hypothetical protein